jgi:hypothetical protein
MMPGIHFHYVLQLGVLLLQLGVLQTREHLTVTLTDNERVDASVFCFLSLDLIISQFCLKKLVKKLILNVLIIFFHF